MWNRHTPPQGTGAGVAWAHGFKCVGVFKGPDDWVREKTEAELLKRHQPFDKVERLEDDEK